jgi:hypothetical protein
MLRKPLSMACRFGVGAVLAATLVSGAVAVAAPAGAATPQLGNCNVITNWTITATSITGDIHTDCPLNHPPITPDPVAISKLEGTQFVTVATGEGTATYNCNGSASNEFVIGGHEFSAACG